jgi:hypothetical protein
VLGIDWMVPGCLALPPGWGLFVAGVASRGQWSVVSGHTHTRGLRRTVTRRLRSPNLSPVRSAVSLRSRLACLACGRWDASGLPACWLPHAGWRVGSVRESKGASPRALEMAPFSCRRQWPSHFLSRRRRRPQFRPVSRTRAHHQEGRPGQRHVTRFRLRPVGPFASSPCRASGNSPRL